MPAARGGSGIFLSVSMTGSMQKTASSFLMNHQRTSQFNVLARYVERLLATGRDGA